MGKSRIRLLLNAEPFGFGPTAAIAALQPYLRDGVAEIAYIGAGHTLDLQKQLPYSAVYDQTKLSPQQLRKVFGQYDVLLTASDFDMARAAKAAGLKLCIYDPLAWYWSSFPRIAKAADLYIAQDFYGVRERLATVFNQKTCNLAVVPPIVSESKPKAKRQGVLLNLGGLQNPHWPLDQAVAYARTMLAAVRKALPKGEGLAVATSTAIARALNEPDVRTYSVDEMKLLRQHCRVALQTPGLGNIFDSAADRAPVVWLPPANDSQGQQADLVALHCKGVVRVDWADICPSWKINYKAAQPCVLQSIASANLQLADTPELQKALQHKLALALRQPSCATRPLLSQFGQGGAQLAAQAVLKFCHKLQAQEAVCA